MNDFNDGETKKFIEILFNNYKKQNKEKLAIDSRLLKSCGFDIDAFGVLFNIICPRLKNDGILKEYNSLGAIYGDLPKEPIENKKDLFMDAIGEVHFINKEAEEKFKQEKENWIKDIANNHTYFTFVVNGEKLEERVSLGADSSGKITEKKAIKKGKQKGKIEKITIIEMNNGKRLIAINDNYNEAKPIKSSEWWDIFIREIKERGMTNRTNVKEISKGMVDYFNYNKGKCPIYMGGQYDLTEVFIGKGIDTMINQEVKTKTMTEKQYSAQKNRKK